jgi:murein DD-endopeptidase MepM/ murein hydrolase activator NlpD
MLNLARPRWLEKAEGFRRGFRRAYQLSFFSGAVAVVLSLTARAGDVQTQTDPQGSLRLVKRIEGNLQRFFVENLADGDMTVTFDLKLQNLESNTRFPFTSTVPPRRLVEAFTLSPLDSAVDWNYSMTNYFTLGSSEAVHDDSVLYSLPYAEGKGYRVSQAFGGSFSHTGGEQYAIDWKMPEGTPVMAARGGVVVAVKDNSDRGGAHRKFEADANYVLVEHPDGTIGNYAHLMKNGVRVRVGQSVKTGDLLGHSGNTGFSSGPHLHFCVFKTRNGRERESVPIRFKTEKGATMVEYGQTYVVPKAYVVSR